MSRFEKLAFYLALLASAGPALAGPATAPAPMAGAGIGAVALLGLGYRLLRSRIGR
jgi:hypothetical protein